MRKKQSKKRTGLKTKTKSKPKRKISRRKNPALGYINTSDNKKEALEIEGINSEPLLGGIILKFYLVGVEESFDVLLYNFGVTQLANKLGISRTLYGWQNNAEVGVMFSRLEASDIGYINKHKIIDIYAEKLIGGMLIRFNTDYMPSKNQHLHLRSLKKGATSYVARKYGSLNKEYIITLYDSGIMLLKKALNKPAPRTISGHIEDVKPITWDDFERGSF